MGSNLEKLAETLCLNLDVEEDENIPLLVYDDGNGLVAATIGDKFYLMVDGLLIESDPKKKGITASRSLQCCVRVVSGKKAKASIFVAFNGKEVDFSPEGTPTVRVSVSKQKSKIKKKKQ